MIDPNSFGGIGEQILKRWLMDHRYWLIPTTAIENGGAPMLESDIERIILPDFQIWKDDGFRAWVDAKSKARAVFYQKLQRWQTGCALRHFHAYRKVAEMTRTPGALAFIHTDTATLHFGMIDWIESDAQYWPMPKTFDAKHPFKEDMIFFNLARFDKYDISRNGLFEKLEEAVIQPKIIRPWETNRKPPQMKQGLLW